MGGITLFADRNGRPKMGDDVPADVLRQRAVFARLREDVRRAKIDGSPMNWDVTEAEVLESLDKLERMLEVEEVRRMAAEWCEQVEREAAGDR